MNNEKITQDTFRIHIKGRPLGLAVIVFYKLIWGVIEMISGLLMLWSSKIIVGELIEDPQDLFINWIARHILIIPHVSQWGVLFLILGATKLLLAVGLWYRSWAMRKALIVFFIALLLFSVYHASRSSTGIAALAALADAAVLYYLWKILPRHLDDVT